MKRIDLVGKKFGKLLVIEEAGRIGKNKNLSWLCRCDCGREKAILGCNLTGGKSLSCGCAQKEALSKISKTHGFSKTRLYGVYKGIKQRCYNPKNPAYKHYGGRGIIMCEEWRMSFVEFRAWALSAGYDENAQYGKFTLDRIDPNGNYEPSNCRWETMQVQQNNKLNSAFVTIGDKRLTIAEWADYKTTNKQTLYSKFYRLFEQLGIDADDIADIEIKLKCQL